jgi:5-hydroxyisourate hydrolase-like protein (transthyretin family)
MKARDHFLVVVGLFVFAGCVCSVSALPSISGVVLAEDTGKPIVNALVRVSSPAIDMRSVRDQRQGVFGARTDVNGRFTIQVQPNPKISLNAFAPGYEEAAGKWMSGIWTYDNVDFPTNREQVFTIRVRPGLYVAGIVTDELGRPCSEVKVEATIQGESSTAYVAYDTTDANGRFEIFDFPLKPTLFEPGTERSQLTFRNAAKLTSIIKDIYPLSELERTNLHAILRSGHDISGVITSAATQAHSIAVVEAVPADAQAAQRTGWTDDDGRYIIHGLPDGKVSVRVHSPAFDLSARKTVQMAGADVELNFRMEPVVLKNPLKPVKMLGMELADVTPELQAVYDLSEPTGVMILDPGPNHVRLGIGGLSLGERFWMVGGKEIRNLKEMVEELLRIDSIAPPGRPNEGCHGNIRVVYSYRNRGGTNTQHLKLTSEDIAELERIRLAFTP